MDGEMATAIIAYRESIPGGTRFKTYEDLKVGFGPTPPPLCLHADPARAVLCLSQKVPYAGGLLGKKKLAKWLPKEEIAEPKIVKKK